MQNNVDFGRIYEKYRTYTMVPDEKYRANLEIASFFGNRVTGDIVECGTWRGGMIAGIAEVLGPGRIYRLFDSFQGLPPAKEIDGQSALDWQENAEDNEFGNCEATEDDAREAMRMSGAESVRIESGWFDDTLPAAEFPDGIAFLRLDGDWYDSTMTALVALFDKVVRGGGIVIDDYYIWDGCSRAVHDFLSSRSAPERIHSVNGVCCIDKR